MADGNTSVPKRKGPNRRVWIWIAAISVMIAAGAAALYVWPTIEGPDTEPAVVAIPDVVGMEAPAAKEALEGMALQVASVDILDSGEGVAVGTVIAQMPAAGTDWYAGQPVAIAVAAGPDDGTGTVVPDVMGSSFDLAVETLAESGLLGYAITDDPANLDRSDVDVLEQLPAEGVMIRQGTTVLLKLGQ